MTNPRLSNHAKARRAALPGDHRQTTAFVHVDDYDAAAALAIGRNERLPATLAHLVHLGLAALSGAPRSSLPPPSSILAMAPPDPELAQLKRMIAASRFPEDTAAARATQTGSVETIASQTRAGEKCTTAILVETTGAHRQQVTTMARLLGARGVLAPHRASNLNGAAWAVYYDLAPDASGALSRAHEAATGTPIQLPSGQGR